MAITQSGRLDFELSYPPPGGSNILPNVILRTYTDTPSSIFVVLELKNSVPPWDMQLGLFVEAMDPVDGSSGAFLYANYSVGAQLSLDVGPHSLSMNIVGGDINVAVDDWQIDVSGAGTAPRHGTPFLSYHAAGNQFPNQSLPGAPTFPYLNIGAGEDVPMVCFPPAPGSLQFGPSWDVGVWNYYDTVGALVIGLLPVRFVKAGGTFWTNRFIAEETV